MQSQTKRSSYLRGTETVLLVVRYAKMDENAEIESIAVIIGGLNDAADSKDSLQPLWAMRLWNLAHHLW